MKSKVMAVHILRVVSCVLRARVVLLFHSVLAVYT